MQIPMILFTITIERKTYTPEELALRYRQEQTLRELEQQRWELISRFPVYCIRM
ncbi:YrzI family small protein [Brevibacillus sp. SYP-B805]|uniref:YrzI family small protein n=1 Tax=Brevibacillus sp. SYP-B805 TaxID=1578199 RepID=UPI0013EB6BBA|nr:YrzI family small protein [Brevibacillus sp. SYP-B805]NGQ97390.1 YrzI family small protein [Brevibacillus sp. SYP-B805]